MIKLFTILKDIKPEWLFLSNIEYFNIPTEVVVTEPKVVMPRQGRCFKLDMYVRDTIIPYSTLRTLPDFVGTSHEIQVHLYERWVDFGSDGHTDYNHCGWIACPGKYDGSPIDDRFVNCDYYKKWDYQNG